MRISRSLFALLMLVPTVPLTAAAQDALVTGSILTDDDVVEVPLIIRRTRTRVTLETHSYKGGETTNQEQVDKGGFDPLLALYDAAGDLVGAGDDVLEPRNDLDAKVVLKNLSPGDYTIVVTQYDNFAPKKLSKNFDRDGQGNFTGVAFGDGTGQFWDLRGNQRNGEYAFEILGAGCRAEPRASCKAVGSGTSTLSMDNTGAIAWRWNNGPKTKKKKFGKPTTKTDYDMCIYEDGELALELATKAGGKWSGSKKGFKYAKGSGNKDGVTNIKLVSGGDGKAKLMLEASAAEVVLPFANNADVTAQLVSAQGRCWEAVYDDPSTSDAASYEASTEAP